MYANTGDRFKQKAAPRISKVKVFRIIDKTFFLRELREQQQYHLEKITWVQTFKTGYF